MAEAAHPRTGPLTHMLVRSHVLAANEILAEVGMERFQHRGQVDRIGRIEFGVEVDGPAAVTCAFLQQHAIVVHLANQLEPVHYALSRVVGSVAIGAEAGVAAGFRHVLQGATARWGNTVEYSST